MSPENEEEQENQIYDQNYEGNISNARVQRSLQLFFCFISDKMQYYISLHKKLFSIQPRKKILRERNI